MGKEWPARSFKSGNSVAIRVPAALGIEPNRDWTLEERDGELVLRPRADPCRHIDLTGIWGACPGLKPVERISFEPRDGDWAGRHDV